HSTLAALVSELGYGIERRGRFWDIAGFPRELIEKFSARTVSIEKLAAAQSITDPKLKAALGAKTREAKSEPRPRSAIRAAWEARLTPEERDALQGNGQARECVVADNARKDRTGPLLPAPHPAPLRKSHSAGNAADAACQAVTWALEVAFERSSVVSE